MFKTIDDVHSLMEEAGYICDRPLATAVYLGYVLKKPILIEGEPGVGKTEVGKIVAQVLQTRLIRLQCYEGLDAEHALYEWDYARQMLEIQLIGSHKESGSDFPIEKTIFSERFLHKRPLLEAIQSQSPEPVVLLIDEVDRSDEAFEAFLLEVLSDFQITIPEIGTIQARQRPFVVITSNRTRELHDALKRRCLYHWIDYPSLDKELAIVRARVPGVQNELAKQICTMMQRIREMDLSKKPGISETLDWAEALIALNRTIIDKAVVEQTLGCIFKFREDQEAFRRKLDEMLCAHHC